MSYLWIFNNLRHFLLRRLPSSFGIYLTGIKNHGHGDCQDIRASQIPIRTIFDVGANEGQTVKRLRREFSDAEIHSFEPYPPTFQKLQANIGSYSKVYLHQLAFGKSTGKAAFYINRSSVMNSMIETADTTGSVEVDLTTVDEFCTTHAIGTIDLLKVDAEGSDLDVLQGAESMLSAGKIHFILVEVGFGAGDMPHVALEKFQVYLKQFNYLLYGIYGQQPLFDGSPALAYANALFCKQPAE